MPPIATHVTLSVCMYDVVCHTRAPCAKAVGWNEMPFGWNTRVVPSNIVLDRGSVPTREVKIWGRNPQFAAIAKLIWSLFMFASLTPPGANRCLNTKIKILEVTKICFCSSFGCQYIRHYDGVTILCIVSNSVRVFPLVWSSVYSL